MTLREKRKQDTRRAILDAAYALFAEKGYARTTMRGLADRAGIGLGTIFAYFPDKPSLLAAAFQDDVGTVIRQALATLPPRGVAAQLLHVAEGLYAFYAADTGLARTLVREALFLDGEHGQALDAQLQDFLRAVEGLVAAAVRDGELAESTAPGEAALAFGAFYFSVLVLGLKQPRFDVQAQLRLLASLLETHLASLKPGR